MDDNLDVDGVQVRAVLDDRGREVGDPVPVAPPIGMSRSPTMIENIRTMVRREMSEAAQLNQMETFDEADDFDVVDDPLDPSTPYEVEFDPVPAKEVSGGKSGVDEGGKSVADTSSGKPGKIDESQSKSEPVSDDKGSVSKASVGDTGGKG